MPNCEEKSIDSPKHGTQLHIETESEKSVEIYNGKKIQIHLLCYSTLEVIFVELNDISINNWH